MRAGQYATVDGGTFPARFTGDSPVVRLVHFGDRPSDDFRWNFDLGGGWVQDVPRDRCSRLLVVAAAAYWRDYPVRVDEIRDHYGTARVTYRPGVHPGPVRFDEHDRLLGPPWPYDPDTGWTGSVPQGELIDVREEILEVPLEPDPRRPLHGPAARLPAREPVPVSEDVVVRAGQYAVLDGVTYQARLPGRDGQVSLIVRGERPSPGFERDDRGHWRRTIPRGACSRVFHVATSAYWHRLFPVEVRAVDPGARTASIEYFPGPHPGPPPLGPDGSYLVPPLFAQHGGPWHGTVPQGELSTVREQEYELPGEPRSAPLSSPSLPPRDHLAAGRA